MEEFTCKDCLCSKCEYNEICFIVCNEEEELGVTICNDFKEKGDVNNER